MRNRIIPILLLKGNGLYKGKNFKKHKYIGDPINAVRIFNEKEVDELVFLDITASNDNRIPNFEMLKDIASECFMPLSYGGGIISLEMIREIIGVGIEKVILNTQAVKRPDLVKDAVAYFGSSTISVSIDAKKSLFGSYSVYINSGTEKTKYNPVDWARELERLGVGEIIINSIDKDGTLSGYDYDLISSVTNSVNIPVVAAGGANGLNDFVRVCKESKAAAAAAGAHFVFQGKHNAVLITYPSQDDIVDTFINF